MVVQKNCETKLIFKTLLEPLENIFGGSYLLFLRVFYQACLE
jgi:hypothetical protein